MGLALFDMPNLNRFDILSISIFCKIALSISISIFSKITISISISISIFLELPYQYRYRYFSELPYQYRYRYRYFQLLHINIDIFQKCRYINNRYVISIYRTGLVPSGTTFSSSSRKAQFNQLNNFSFCDSFDKSRTVYFV